MSARSQDIRTLTWAASLAAGALIAHQVGGKATRDALFLSNFDVVHLPTMLIVASVVSIGVVLGTARLMRAVGPGRLLPVACTASGVLSLAEFTLFLVSPSVAAIVVYLHVAGFGAVIISSFWSLVNEAFDPRTAKQAIGRIGAGSTLGGLIGGVLAERAAVYLDVGAMLLVLAALHFFVGWRILRIARGIEAGPSEASPKQATSEPDSAAHGLEVLAGRPYLRNLAALVMLGTVGATLLDYVFKAEAVEQFTEPDELLRFFAVFYTAIGLLTFLVQSGLAKRALQRLGLANTVATLPASLVATGAGALLVPGLASAALARGTESILRSSLYRSGYELLYTPLPASDRRSTKTIVDVGFDRLGDAVGGGLTKLILVVLAAHLVNPVLLAGTVVLALAALWVSRRLHRGYIKELENSLVTRAVELDLTDIEDETTRSTLLQTMGTLDIREALRKLSGDEGSSSSAAGPKPGSLETPLAVESPPPRTRTASGQPTRIEPIVAQILDLRSGDPERIRPVLGGKPLTPPLVPHVLPLLAWDELSEDALKSLRRIAKRITGQLIDVLLDRDEEFAIRRRVPRAMAWARTQRAVDGLILGLDDRRFEVRFQCGRAVSHIVQRKPSLTVDRETVLGVVEREAHVDRRVWESHRLLDQTPDDEQSAPFVDEFLADRTSRSLEHVFTVLSLILPRQPLIIAYRGLHTDDAKLRGTALEYLESTLPPTIREALWPFLEPERGPRLGEDRNREAILADLMRSNRSIQLNLDALRARFEQSADDNEAADESSSGDTV